jgi:subtilase family serine protease
MNKFKTSRLLLLGAIAATVAQATYGQLSHAVMPGPAATGTMRSHAWMLDAPNPQNAPNAASCLTGCYYLPLQLASIYAISSITNANGGAGITVGIVDAYYDSQTLANCNTAASAWGLPTCNGLLTIVNQAGGSPTSTTSCSGSAVGSNAGWAQETNLDVQAVHAIAPKANILLVATCSNQDTDLGAGDVYAQAHAQVVTNSFGGGEFVGEATTYDPIFGLTTATVPVLYSSGDTGALTEYPCVSALAICVGGTSLTSGVNGAGNYYRLYEQAWGLNSLSNNAPPEGAGGGCSSVITMPAFQTANLTGICGGTQRAVPDVSALADPQTGFAVFLGTFAGEGTAGGYVFGGTSLASPLTAAVLALIDAHRVANSQPLLGTSATVNAALYALYHSSRYHYDFYDVTLGSTCSAASCSGGNVFPASAGWDKATGIGVILGPALSLGLP